MNAIQSAGKESEALQFGRDFLVALQSSEMPWMGREILPLTKSGSRTAAREVFKAGALSHPRHMMMVVEYARAGWDIADEALRELIIEFVDRGQQLPTYLASYQMDIAAGHAPKTGNQRADRWTRNVAIAALVQEIVRKFGLRPTGRGVTRGRSACGLVSTAWNREVKRPALDYKAIERVWNDYGRLISADIQGP